MRKIKYRDRITTGSTAPQADDENDFGLGDKVARQPGTRLINADGSFNVIRRGRSIFAPYKNLVEMGWPRFIIITVLGYTVCNLGFAVAFYVVGPENLSGVEPSMSRVEQFLQCFYFSVQTFTTVGYGAIAPNSITTNALASLLALFGWIALALATGLFFARFSRPTRLIVFSEKAIVAPLGGGNSLQFRIANKRDTSLINVHAQVVLTYLEEGGPQQLNRHFRPLSLEREFVPLFPLNWTVVHPIVEGSPMFYVDAGGSTATFRRAACHDRGLRPDLCPADTHQ